MPVEPDATNTSARDISVDCLMVTRSVACRLPFAKKSIAGFCAQTVQNKSLIVVLSGGEPDVCRALRDHVASLGRDDIRVFEGSPSLNLGQLRNYCLEVATAEVVCQWDDDDLHHPQRIERQLALLVEGNHEAVYLQEVMQYYPALNTLHWINWRATEPGGLPGTLMMRRGLPIRYPVEGETARLGEDLVVALSLKSRGRVGYLAGMPHLYIYVSHGANSWHDGHHRMLTDELSISQALLRRREIQIREGVAAHDFGTGPVEVIGNNGPAFLL
jgi:glycosyltransferase involved in cell wall biosynthesis